MTVTIKFARLTAVGAEKLGRSELAEKWVQVCGSGGENPIWGLLEGDAPLLLEPGEDFVFSLFPSELHREQWWKRKCPDKHWAVWENGKWYAADTYVLFSLPHCPGMWIAEGGAVLMKPIEGLEAWNLEPGESRFDRRWATTVTSFPSAK